MSHSVLIISQLVINGPSLVAKIRLVALTLIDTALTQIDPAASDHGHVVYFMGELSQLDSVLQLIGQTS
jgi:hypothetical protein